MNELNPKPSASAFQLSPGKFCPALPSPSAGNFFAWAEKLFDSLRYEEALDAYSECLRLEPSNENVLFKRGLTHGLLKNTESCLNDLSSVLLQKFLKEAYLYKQNILENKNQQTDTSSIRQAIPESGEFFEAMFEFQDLGKSLRETFDPFLNEQEGAENVKQTLERALKQQESSVTEKEVEDAKMNPRSLADLKEAEKFLAHRFESTEKEAFTQKNEKRKNIIRLSDVQGLENVKEKLWNNIVLPLKRPDLFTKYNKKRSFAILLYGPPGCGKTLLARALAGETGSSLVLANLHEIMDMWQGETEKKMHQIFENARTNLKGNGSCIVFLDELDALGVNRGLVTHDSGAHRAVNQLLMELDGALKNPEGLVVIAASNRPWDIDAALKRSGRFGECIYIPAPSCEDRRQLFKYYIGNCVVSKVDFGSLAEETEGCSASDIESIVEEAKMRPILREHRSGHESSLDAEDLKGVLVETAFGKGTLRDWYVSVANELSNEPMDTIRYKPLVDAIKKALQRSNHRHTMTPST